MRAICCVIAASFVFATSVRANPNPDTDTHAAEADGVEAVQLERPAPDQGYYLTLGVHAASVNALNKGTWLRTLGGLSGSLRLGQALTRYFDLGIRIDFGGLLLGERDGVMASFGLDATLRPYGSWLVRLGLGLGGCGVSAPPDSDHDAGTFGAIASLDVGYGWFPFYRQGKSGSLALVPVARVMMFQSNDHHAIYWLTLGVEVTWWTGLPRRQLDLPPSEAFSK